MKSNQSIQAIELEKENWVGAMSPPFLVKVDQNEINNLQVSVLTKPFVQFYKYFYGSMKPITNP